MTSSTHKQHTSVVALHEHLPEHLRQVAEGAIIDWLIRTGQWDAAAQAKLEAQQQHIESAPPEKMLPRPNQP